MQISFDDSDIRQQVLDFLNSMAIYPYDERDIILDGELHRFRTKDDKAGQTSGAIRIYTDGCPAGFVQDWRRGIKEDWKYDTSKFSQEQLAYFNSEEFKGKAKEQHRKAEEKRRLEKFKVSEIARQIWSYLMPAPDNHPYLLRKRVKSYGLRMDGVTHELAVPLVNISGQIMSIQWIPPEPKSNKLFYKGASLEGAFYSAGLETLTSNPESEILLGEGYATIAKVHELTSKPCVAAMSCYRLKETAQILRKAYPDAKIIVTADNDWETEKEREFNPGIREAKFIVNAGLAIDYAAPEFTENDTGLSDWDDYALKYGDEKAKEILQQKIQWAVMTPAEREEYKATKELKSIAVELDKHKTITPEDFIAGIFPRKRISAVVAPPGTGKTWFLQRVVSDLSVGGAIFDGFYNIEAAMMCVVFAGEAGPDMMIRRAAATQWPVNKHNVQIYGMVNAEKQGISLMLDENEGRKNIERIIKLHKPDIVFIDTLGSFHNSDENKADEMKPILRWLLTVAEVYETAIVLMHHSRKMSSKEVGRTLTQDDVIGSSIFNRLVSVIVCLQPPKAEEDSDRFILVKSLKSWFHEFMPFTYRLADGAKGRIVMEIDLTPSSVSGVTKTKFELWNYILKHYTADEWFKASDLLQAVEDLVNPRQLQRYLSAFVTDKKLRKRGEGRWTEYSVFVSFYDLG